jgi:hypothetical protein
MAHFNGWFPTRQGDIIQMAGAWEVQIDLYGLASGIPPDLITRFKSQLAAGCPKDRRLLTGAGQKNVRSSRDGICNGA